MKIAICDDDKIILSELKNKIYEYSNLHNWESVIDTYESGYELIKSKIKYNIIILDYQMNDINGLETAKLLRNGSNKLSCIIFLTSYPEIAIPAYEVDTYRFIVKNAFFDGLFNALDDFRNSSKKDYDISFKVEDEYLTINTESIAFVEVKNKFCYIHMSNGDTILTKTTLSNLFKELPHTHFFKTHKAFVINFEHISERTNIFVKVKNYNYEIPISRNYLTQFKHKYYKYLRDQK